MNRRDRILNTLGWAAFLFSASVFFLPVANPDLYWHLSAGKYTLANFGPPHADFLSWPLAGTEWVDFEWLPQVFYYLLYKAGGFKALLIFKSVLLLLILLVFRATVLLYGRRSALPFLLPFFAAAIMSNCDLRPENFTLLFFSLTLYFLEKTRLSSVPPGWRLRGVVFAFFALWANLHAGYLYGLALIGLYSAGELLLEELAFIHGKGPFARPGKSLEYLKLFFIGLVSSLATPYGWRVYSVIANHQKYIDTLQEHVQEWASFSLSNPYQWPYVLALTVVMGCFLYFLLRRKHIVYSHFAALLFFAWASASHARHIPFFIITGLAFALALPWQKPNSSKRWRAIAWGGSALWLGVTLWFYSSLVWTQYTGKARLSKWSSDGLASFLRSNKPVLAGLRLYNHWSWGGWLGWELGPDYKPFIDGRYIFHDRVAEIAALSGSISNWAAISEKYKFDLALMKLDEPNIPVKQRLPGGEEAVYWRPTYLFYLPRRDWAVVYWDYSVAALVRRGSVPAAWLAAHELRYLRSGDVLNLRGPLLAGDISMLELRRELEVYLRGHDSEYSTRGNAHLAAFVNALGDACAKEGSKCAK
ncbi:MAG: hypothetical protein COX65_02345 [Elusimicrobia bacterium CG_4_10_14_0_2_um_filter_56_8]|nr:MAG: hypothetical protein AUJ51_01930 [Elusimicrobia bacterium CG1_02_56_21]PJA16528.1 MAG: hypothetical protein COX65_02345 [Elusimicrobia bacterium CG_4_10_14_0_2_um_filter_56_8]